MPHSILLIDDSSTQLEILSMHFRKDGFDVVTAKDGYEGYRKIFKNPPDLIVSDIMMPNLNGFQLCRLIKNNPDAQQVPIILLTALTKKLDKFWANKSGADKFISKMTEYSDIREMVQDVIDRNPVSDEYKRNMQKKNLENGDIQKQVNEIFDDLLMNSTILNEFRDLEAFVNNEKILIEKLFILLNSFLDYNICGLYISHHDQNSKNILHMDINKISVSNFVVEKVKRDFFTQIPKISSFNMRDFGHDVIKKNVEKGEIVLNLDGFKTKHFIPLEFNDILVGGLCFYYREEIDYTELKYYETMIKEMVLLLRMRYLYSETEYISVIDGLTGLYNRRHFESNLEREFLRTIRYPSHLSLAMIDIDHFKNINDTYGHQFGDYVLREISGIIVSSFRKTDMVYRYGGEEITVILTETPLENALIPLERLRKRVAEFPFIYNNTKTDLTISIGVSCNFAGLKNHKGLLECADKALYEAKENGRNKVVAFKHDELNKISE